MKDRVSYRLRLMMAIRFKECLSLECLKLMAQGPVHYRDLQAIDGRLTLSTLMGMSQRRQARKVTVAPKVQHWALTPDFLCELKAHGVLV